jgi:hypothetical protein
LAAFAGIGTPQVQHMDVHAAEASGRGGRNIAPPGGCGVGSIVVGCCVDRRFGGGKDG